MSDTNNSKLTNYKTDDEIDLVDILAVIIKRKWSIIILLILSLILSVAYVKLHKTKTKSIKYSTSFSVSLPEEYTINTDYILSRQTTDTTFFIDYLSRNTNQYEMKNGNSISTSVRLDARKKLINIDITGNNKDNAKEASLFVYKLYKDYKDKLLEKDKNLFNIAQNSLNQELKQKQAILDMLMGNLNKSSLLKKNQSINGTLVYIIDFLSNDISNIKRIKLLNQQIILNEGKIEISNGSKRLILSDETIGQIDNYIKPEIPSKKKTLLPVVVSVFLALFVGIFLAFVIEFFSREDVKTRLKAASKK